MIKSANFLKWKPRDVILLEYCAVYNTILCWVQYSVHATVQCVQDNKLSSVKRCEREDPFTALCSQITVVYVDMRGIANKYGTKTGVNKSNTL
jgi:uncharacterized membrane protein